MNNTLEKFLASLTNSHKKIIHDNCIQNENFNNFIKCCSNLNISLFEHDDINYPKKHSYLLERTYNYQEALIKNYGLKIIKEYQKNKTNIINFLKDNFNKLNYKIEITNKIIYLLENKINSMKLNELLTKPVVDRKIEYTDSCTFIENKSNIEYIDFSHDIFITSDDVSTDEEISKTKVNLNMSKNTLFIAEYSN